RLLPPGARGRGPGRADAQPRRRPRDAGDRTRVHRSGSDPRTTTRAREAEDSRRRYPTAGSARAPAPRAAANRARCDLSRLQRRLRPTGSPGALRRGDTTRAPARDPDAGRRRGARPARARAAPGRAPRCPRQPRGPPRAAGGPGQRTVGHRGDRPGPGRPRPCARASAARAVLLRRLDRSDEAAVAYERALALAPSEVERGFLRARLLERLHGDP